MILWVFYGIISNTKYSMEYVVAKRYNTLDLIFQNPISTKIRFKDVKALLTSYGFDVKPGGGSRNKAVNREHKIILIIHAHNPGDCIKPYNVREIREALIKLGIEK